MSYGITREEALALLEEQLHNPNLIKHSLATEAVMGVLAERLGGEREEWMLAGLLHDLDAEATAEDLSAHTHQAAKLLREKGVAESIVRAIGMHNEAAQGKKRSETFHHALAAGETITGLIIATALVYPDRRLASVKAKSVRKRMKEKAFAAGVDREIVLECERIGIPLDEFIGLCLGAMQGIAEQLGL